MSDHLELMAEVLRAQPNLTRDQAIEAARQLRAQRQAAQPTPASDAWAWANKPLVSPDFGQSFPGRAASTAVELGTTPLNIATLGLGLGAGAAGARGLMGISKGARIAEAALQAPMVLEGANIAGQGLQQDDPVRAALGAGEAVMGGLGMRSAMKHSFPMDKVAAAYSETKGLAAPVAQRDVLDPLRSRAIADAYAAMPHAPQDPAVAQAYGALGNEVSDQFAFLRDRAGMKMEPWTQEGQPYANSAAMAADVKKNNHLWYFPTEGGYGDGAITDNPLLKQGRSGVPLNGEFRAVHDAFGHATRGHQFGPRGEDLAWQEHRQMFTPEAVPALTTETRGQNSWVNFGPQMRSPEGALLKKGDPGYLGPAERAYAPQKTGLLPEWATEPEGVPPAVEAAPSAPASAAALAPPTAAPDPSAGPLSETAAPSASPAPEEMFRFTHRSPLDNLEQLDPAAAYANPSAVGSGAELKRAGLPGYQPRTYVTPEGGFVEHRFRGLKNVYEGEVPKSKIYDLEKDPDGLKATLADRYPNGGPEFLNALEGAVKDKGYLGYQAQHAVALFHPTTVRRQGSALDQLARAAGDPSGTAPAGPSSPGTLGQSITDGGTKALGLALPVAAVSGDPSKDDNLTRFGRVGALVASAAMLGAGVRVNALSADKIAVNKLAARMLLHGATASEKGIMGRLPEALRAKVRTQAAKMIETHAAKAVEGLPDFKKLVAAFHGAGEGNHTWYDSTNTKLNEMFGEDGPMMGKFLAVTSSNATVKSNATLAAKAYRQWKAGEPFEGYRPVVKLQLERVARGEDAGGRKITEFAKALSGDPEAVVVDRWMLRAFGFNKDAATDRQYDLIEQVIRDLAKKLDKTPRQVQAALWFEVKNRTELATKGRIEAAPPFETLIQNSLKTVDRARAKAAAIKASPSLPF